MGPELPVDVDRPRRSRRAHLGDRAVPRVHDRPRLQRVHLHTARRAVRRRGSARRLGGRQTKLAEVAEQGVVELLAAPTPGPRRRTTGEFYAGMSMDARGARRAMFTPTLASKRVIGACADVLAQAVDN